MVLKRAYIILEWAKSYTCAERVIKKSIVSVFVSFVKLRGAITSALNHQVVCAMYTQRDPQFQTLYLKAFFHTGVLYLVSTLNNICLDSITLLKPEENPIKIPRVYLYPKRGVLQRRKPQEE